METHFTNEDASASRIAKIPADTIRAVGFGVICRRTSQYSAGRTSSGLYLASEEDSINDKKYIMGEVVAVGSKCTEIKPGNIVLAVKQTVHRIPNGTEPFELFKVEENALSIIAVLPNDPSTAIEPEIGVAEGAV